jgi:hypothetical protein
MTCSGANTCPGPLAVVVGQGRFSVLAVTARLLGGVTLQNALERPRAARREVSAADGLMMPAVQDARTVVL